MRKRLAMACLSLCVLTGAAALLSACGTVAGNGKDAPFTGNSISDGGDQKQQARTFMAAG
jgi:predicted small secreted protein